MICVLGDASRLLLLVSSTFVFRQQLWDRIVCELYARQWQIDFSERVNVRLKLPQYRSTFIYNFCDIWGSHWQQGICRKFCLRIQMLANYDDCLKLRKKVKVHNRFRLFYVMLLLYFSSTVQCFCAPANTVQTSCLWLVRLSMPFRSSEGIFKRLNCLLQSIASFSYLFSDIWGSHWRWEWGICRNLVFSCRSW